MCAARNARIQEDGRGDARGGMADDVLRGTLRAKRRFESGIGMRSVRRERQAPVGDPDDPEDASWKKAIEDEQKMFMLAQELWLSLSHCGEACLRVAVELICDRKARKVALRRELDDSTKKEINVLSRNKLKLVTSQLKGGSAMDQSKFTEMEAQMKSLREADAKELLQAKELVEQTREQLEKAQEEIKHERHMREAMAREHEAAEQGKMEGMRKLQAELKQLKSGSSAGEDFIRNLELERDLAQRSVTDLQLRVEELMKDNKHLKQNLVEAKGKSGDAADAVKTLLEEQKAEIEKLQDQAKTLQGQKEEQEKKIFRLEKELRDARDEPGNAAEGDMATQLRLQRDSAEAEASRCADRIASLEKECVKVTEQLQSRIRETSELSGKVEDLQAEIDDLRMQLATAATVSGVPTEVSDELKAALEIQKQQSEAQLQGERRQWARERTRLVEENTELQEKEHKLQSALEELRSRLRKFSELAEKGSMSTEVKELMSQAGLDEVAKEHEGPVRVWDRLYNDFFKRMKRLEAARRKLHDANMAVLQEQQALIWPSEHRMRPAKQGEALDSGGGGAAFGAPQRSSPRKASPREELLRRFEVPGLGIQRGHSPREFRGGMLQHEIRGMPTGFIVQSLPQRKIDGLATEDTSTSDHFDSLELAGMSMQYGGSPSQSPLRERSGYRDSSPRRPQRSHSPPRHVRGTTEDFFSNKGHRDPSPARDKLAAEGFNLGSRDRRDPSPTRDKAASEGAHKVLESHLSIAGVSAAGSSVPKRQRQRLDSDQDSDWDARSPSMVETRVPPLPASSFSPDLDREWAPPGAMSRTTSLPALTGHSLHPVGAGGGFGGREGRNQGRTIGGREQVLWDDQKWGSDTEVERVARQSWGSDTAEVVRSDHNPPRRKPRRAHNTNYLYPASSSRSSNDPAMTTTPLPTVGAPASGVHSPTVGAPASGVALGIEKATDSVVWLTHQ